jgi:threonine/homoserine/homoserine lactone efflux protein
VIIGPSESRLTNFLRLTQRGPAGSSSQLLNPKALLFALVIVPMRAPNATAYLAAFCLIVPSVGSA